MREDLQYYYIFVDPVMFQVNIIMLILVYALDYTKLLFSVKNVSNNT